MIIIRIRQASLEDAPTIRKLVNQAYQQLADMGLNYTATFQDEETTKSRMREGRVFVLEDQGNILGTIGARIDNVIDKRRALYIFQFGVLPEFKGRGLGTQLMSFVEGLAMQEEFECLQLDTAKPATHLVTWYQRLGFQIRGEDCFAGKTYESWILVKDLK